MTQHFRVRNWSSYQSYKDRRPPWIRLHRSLIDNAEFQRMSADARALLPMFWLLACEDTDPVSGMIRMSYEDIAWRLRLPPEKVKSAISEMQDADFIECIESVTEPLQDRISTVTPETETETETEKKDGAKAPSYTEDFNEIWSTYPRRSPNPKKPAFEAYKSKLKKGAAHEDILAGVKKYADRCKAEGTEPTYIAQAVTFLRQERYVDELEMPEVKKGLKF